MCVGIESPNWLSIFNLWICLRDDTHAFSFVPSPHPFFFVYEERLFASLISFPFLYSSSFIPKSVSFVLDRLFVLLVNLSLLLYYEWYTELFHTERSHVRNLKVLDRIFYRPLLDNGFSDLVNLLFPNLPDMLEIHGRFNALMKARKKDQPAVETVGDIVVAMVRSCLLFLLIHFRPVFPSFQQTNRG